MPSETDIALKAKSGTGLDVSREGKLEISGRGYAKSTFGANNMSKTDVDVAL